MGAGKNIRSASHNPCTRPKEEKRNLVPKRLGRFWRDVIRIRQGLSAPSGELLFINWDETPIWADELATEETSVTKGATMVAVNVTHQDSRTKFTTILAMCSNDQVRPIDPAIVFSVHTGGALVKKRLEKELKDSNGPKYPFFITPSGNTNLDIMPEVHAIYENVPPPHPESLHHKGSTGVAGVNV